MHVDVCASICNLTLANPWRAIAILALSFGAGNGRERTPIGQGVTSIRIRLCTYNGYRPSGGGAIAHHSSAHPTDRREPAKHAVDESMSSPDKSEPWRNGWRVEYAARR